MLGICSLSVLESCMKHCLCLFLCIAPRQWYGKRISRVRAVQIDNLRGLLGIRRMDRVSNAWIWVLCGAKKDLNERIDEGVHRWFGLVEKMERHRNAKRVYVG